MRAALCAALVGALVLAGSALATSRDAGPARKALRSATALKASLVGASVAAKVTIGNQQKDCPGLQQSALGAHRDNVATLIYMERIRQLQHDGLADYERFVADVQALDFADTRLQAAQRALSAELATLHKLVGVPIRVCDDLKALANSGFSRKGLTQWAQRIDRQAGVSEPAAARVDAAVNASRSALVSAGLSAAQAKLVVHAETGDLFAGS